MKLTPFHLAIPVKEITTTRDFYRDTLGCKEGRSSDHWVDFDFFGHQLVIHITEEAQKAAVANQELEKALMAIAQSNDVAAQRALFEDVSTLVEAEIALQTITSGTIYKQYCPMAFQGEGAYWLSDSKEVRNPYFGDKMLKCGTVEKELK